MHLLGTVFAVREDYIEEVVDALEKTGYTMYTDMPLSKVPPTVVKETFKETMTLLLWNAGGIEQQHECLEDVILSILLGESVLRESSHGLSFAQ